MASKNSSAPSFFSFPALSFWKTSLTNIAADCSARNTLTLLSKQRFHTIHWLGRITLRFRPRVGVGPEVSGPNCRSSVCARVQSCSKSLVFTITSPERNHTGGNVSKWDTSVHTTRQNASFKVHSCDMPFALTTSLFPSFKEIKCTSISTTYTPKAALCTYNTCLNHEHSLIMS